eukprot:7377438-Prymnesium_polylepis.1
MPELRLFCALGGGLKKTGRLGGKHDARNGMREPDMCRAMSENPICCTSVEFHSGGDTQRMRCYCPANDADAGPETNGVGSTRGHAHCHGDSGEDARMHIVKEANGSIAALDARPACDTPPPTPHR